MKRTQNATAAIFSHLTWMHPSTLFISIWVKTRMITRYPLWPNLTQIDLTSIAHRLNNISKLGALNNQMMRI